MPESAADLAPLDPAFWRVLDDGVDALGLALTPGVRAAIDAHVRLLLAWNAAINLTALRTPQQIARGHVLDSLSAAATVDHVLRRSAVGHGARKMLDLGSGGGFPGLPLGMAVGVDRLALVDSVQKKAGFLRVAGAAATAAMSAAGERAPTVDALPERAEDLADEPDVREGWQLVVARAVGSLSEVAELSLPLLAVGGHLVAWKRDSGGSDLRSELDAAREIAQACGGSRAFVERIPVADGLGLAGHVLVTIRKARPTPDRYPRQPSERKRAALR